MLFEGVNMNKQIIFTEKNVAQLCDVEKQAPGPGEVRVKMCYTAISAGTERANLTGDPYVNGGSREPKVKFPRTVGYSGSGIVDCVGEDVKGLRPGDRVVTYWGKHKLYNTLPESNVVRIEDERVDMKEAAFVFISTFPLAAIRKVEIELGESCLVVGLGPLGMLAVQYAHLNGAMPVIAADLKPERREMALRLGADIALDPAAPDYAEQLKALTGGKGVNTVIEVTGNPAAMENALRAMAPMGRIALLGCTRQRVEVDFYHDVHFPGVQILGAHTNARPQKESYPHHWTHYDDCVAALKYLAAGRLNIRDMISETHAPKEAFEVFARLANDEDFPMGVVFDWQQVEE